MFISIGFTGIKASFLSQLSEAANNERTIANIDNQQVDFVLDSAKIEILKTALQNSGSNFNS